jgi:integrase
MSSLIYHVKNFNNGGEILISQISSKWVEDFQNYLLKNMSQTSAAHYSKLLRSALGKAVSANIIVHNPAETVKGINAQEADLVFLNIDEMRKLAGAKPDDDSGMEIRRAFIFACYTGLRVSDLETITWGQIETEPMQIIKRQVKTKTPVYIPLNETVRSLILNDGKEHKPDDRVFDLPHEHRRQSYHVLKSWAESANIGKNIGWHTARRTFATLALENKADIYTVAKLLGHTSLKQVAKYAKVTDKLRREAVAALPELDVNA